MKDKETGLIDKLKYEEMIDLQGDIVVNYIRTTDQHKIIMNKINEIIERINKNK